MTRAAGAMSLAITLSRLTGLLREVTIANRFPKEAQDAFWAAFRVPNMLRELLAEGALNAAFVPVYTDVQTKQGAAAAFRLANSVLSVLMIVTGLFGLSIALFSHGYVWTISSGFAPAKLEMAATVARFLAPFLTLLSFAAVLMGMANVRGRYFLPAAASGLFNLAMVASALWLTGPFEARGYPAVAALGLGSVLGGALQLAIQLPGVYSDGFRFRPVFDRVGGALWQIMSRMAPALIGVSATYLNTVIDTQIASNYGDGPVSYLTYAFRLWMLPVGMFGVAISTVNLTNISRGAAIGDHATYRKTLGESIRMTLLLNVPAAVGLAVLATPILRVIYQHKHFDADATTATAPLLAFYAVGLPAYALIKLYVPTLYALRRPWVPVGVSMGIIAAKVITNYLLWRAGLPFAFLALTTGIAACLNALITGWLLRREIGGLRGERIGRTTLLVCLAAAVMALVCWGSMRGLQRWLPGESFAPAAIRLAITIAIGAAVFFLVTDRLGLPESAQLRARLQRLSRSHGGGNR